MRKGAARNIWPRHGLVAFVLLLFISYFIFHSFVNDCFRLQGIQTFFFQLLLLLNKKYKPSIPTLDLLKYCKAIYSAQCDGTCIHFFVCEYFDGFFYSISSSNWWNPRDTISSKSVPYFFFCSLSLFLSLLKKKKILAHYQSSAIKSI